MHPLVFANAVGKLWWQNNEVTMDDIRGNKKYLHNFQGELLKRRNSRDYSITALK
jgi:hypothetical protein